MPFNGSGTFTVEGTPFVADTPALAEEVNAKLDDIADGLSDVVTRDGQSEATGNWPLGGFKLENLGDGSARGDSLNVGQVQDGDFTWCGVSSGATDAYVVALTPAPEAYVDGMRIRFTAHQANTGASTINVNGLGARNLTKITTSQALAADDISADQVVEAVYVQADNVFVTCSATTPQVGTIVRIARTSNTILDENNIGRFIEVTSGTFTQTFTAAATLGTGWYVYYGNSGTGIITLDPNGGETIDGAATRLVYPGQKLLIQCNGSNFFTVIDDELPTVPNSTRNSDTVFSQGDTGKLYVLSGTYTQTYDAAATLGSGWQIRCMNAGTGQITHDPNGSETIGGASTAVMNPGDIWDIASDGTNLILMRVSGNNYQLLTSGTSWPVPAGVYRLEVEAVGGGSGKYDDSGNETGGSSGGRAWSILAVTPGASIAYSIGAAGVDGGAAPTNGGDTTFGSLTATGGVAPTNSAYGGAPGQGSGGVVNGMGQFGQRIDLPSDEGLPGSVSGGSLGGAYGSGGAGPYPAQQGAVLLRWV